MTATAGPLGAGASTGARTRPLSLGVPWRKLDVTLVGALASIAGIGLLMVYSATRQALAGNGIDPHYYLKRQALNLAIGAVLLLATLLVDYRRWRPLTVLCYSGICLMLLAVVSPLGARSKGHQAWFPLGAFQLQPSEFAKVGVIFCLAVAASSALPRRRDEEGPLRLARLIGLVVLAGVPMALIMLQPDLGTDLVFLGILFAMLVVAGVRLRHLVALVVIGAAGVALVIHLGVLQRYQVDRLTAFLDPTGDTRNIGYNLAESQTAIGSGGTFGKGLFKGTQTNLSYVPEQRTDFIFTAVGEQLGFAGSALLLVLFALVVWRCWRAALLAPDKMGTLICVGVMALLVFQLFENVGMTMGIMPIAGIPLPFVSYGGSAVIAYSIGVGLVLNVNMRRFP
ncbi:MAG TPA: rod shape-determining protein RodA [Acidimicrobiales bacterium]|nr:rod shape-determining protein RodA [Acidimicrobiales bacterium]